MENSKSLVLALLEVLTKYSDEDHILTRTEVDEHLDREYDIQIERRTFYNNINLLIDFGYDISTYEENRKGYYLRERDLEKSEVSLLCNLIHSSHIIPETDSKNLINKILKTQSKYEAKKFKEKVYAKNARKTINHQFFLNIELINEAIQNYKKISFVYTKYDFDKNRIPRREELYQVSPYAVVYMNDNYYLICKYDNYKDFSHYRIDKIQDISILEEKVEPLDKELEPYEYAKNKIYMYGGENETIYLKCKNYILDDILDNFGLNTNIVERGEDYFVAKVQSSKEGIIFWALQYLKFCKIESPEYIKEEFIEILQNELEDYKK